MNCMQAQDVLAGRAEVLMAAVSWSDFEDHLSECPCCAERLAGTESVRRIVRSGCRRLVAPRSLWSRILGALPHRVA